MDKSRIYSILILALVFLTAGCDKACKSTIQDFATIQNTTGMQLGLNVCKGSSYGEVQAIVSASGTHQEVSLGSRKGTKIQGGMEAMKSCSASESKMEMEISLSPASFGQVRLCYDEVSKLYVVIKNYQSCPSGYLEQVSTGPCDTF
ncbi:MAG: hypothetical protein AABZ31_01995 [Bdellovibrionota bacterium]